MRKKIIRVSLYIIEGISATVLGLFVALWNISPGKAEPLTGPDGNQLEREYTIGDKLNFMNGSMFSLEHMWNEVIHANLPKDIDSMQVPVYIFHGKYDYTTLYSVAKDF